MANQTGTYSDVHDFINKLQTFAASNGWTVNKFTLGSGTSSNTEAYLQNGSQYVNIEGSITNLSTTRYASSVTIDRPRIQMWGSTGFNGGSAINAQPGSSDPRVVRNEWIISPGLGYWFYSDASTYIHAVAETVANEFQHVVFGSLNKAGTYTGGNYIDATLWTQGSGIASDPLDTEHSAAFDSMNTNTDRTGLIYVPAVTANGTNGWHNIATAFGTEVGSTEGYAVGSVRGPGQPMHTFVQNTLPNNFNDATALLPIHMYIGRPSGLISPLGTVTDVRYVNIQYLNPKDTLTLGGDTWQVFPIATKWDPLDTTDGRHNSGYHGYAYRVF